MAKKKVAAIVRIQIPAGQATPAPPVGTALGPHGIAIMDFCKAYNAATENQRGMVIPAEITMGLERLSMFLQGKQSAFELEWAPGLTWGDVYRENERQWSVYNFEEAPVDVLARRFAEHEDECAHLIDRRLPLPAYDQVLKCSHILNLLDARGAVSATERAAYILRARSLTLKVARLYTELLDADAAA